VQRQKKEGRRNISLRLLPTKASLPAQDTEEQHAGDGADDGHGESPDQQFPEELRLVLVLTGAGNAQCTQRRQVRGIDKVGTDVDILCD